MVMFMANRRRCHLPRGAVTTYCQPYAHILCGGMEFTHQRFAKTNSKRLRVRKTKSLLYSEKETFPSACPLSNLAPGHPVGKMAASSSDTSFPIFRPKNKGLLSSCLFLRVHARLRLFAFFWGKALLLS